MFGQLRYHYPPFSILSQPQERPTAPPCSGEEIAALVSLVTPARCTAIQTAPQSTAYHIELDNPLSLPKLRRSLPSLEAVLHQPVALMPSRSAHVALELANTTRSTVSLTRCLTALKTAPSGLLACLGISQANEPLFCDLSAMPHTLVAGATGSGKSVLVNSIIASLCMAYTPNDCRFLMIDPKQVELTQWSGLRNFLHAPIITGADKAVTALEDVCSLMDGRYRAMKRKRVTSCEGLFPRLVIVIDELADLMLTSRKRVETAIVRIAQLGRAAGIHLLLATQRPTANVVTGLIKANVPCRIALKVASSRDSLVVLDQKGAENLIGRGDALVRFPDRVELVRFQAPYTSQSDIAAIAGWWSKEPHR